MQLGWQRDYGSDKVLLEMFCCDMLQSSKPLSRDKQDPVLVSFKIEWLLHNLMTRGNGKIH